MKRLVATLLATTTLILLGCQQPIARLNAPPHGSALRTSELREVYDHMIDNALLEDMSISDIHFLPHQARLNELGRQRLQRLAGLLEVYGGTVRFNTSLDDSVLVEARTDEIIAFLCDQGIDTSANVLRRDLPGGRGIDADQAILIKAHEATYDPERKTDHGESGMGG